MIKVRGGNSHKTKIALAGLTVGALATVAKPALFSQVYAAANTFDWERQEDVDRLNGYYSSAARSANGTHLILGVAEGGENQGQGDPSPLYVSANSAASWENVAPDIDPETRNAWSSVDVSNDGQTMVAASQYGMDIDTTNDRNGKIYISENSGSTWEDVTPVGGDDWERVVISGDGDRIVAVKGADSNELYISDNGGDSWSTPNTDEFWEVRSLSVSDDGDKIFVGGENGDNYAVRLYVSENNGTDWADIAPEFDGELYDLKHDVSADGSKIVIATNGSDDAVFVSDDSGQNWTEANADTPGTIAWMDAAMSDDGSRLSVIGSDGQTYVSSDFGTSWIEENPGQSYADSNQWVDGDFNSDGTQMIVAGRNNVYVTTSNTEPEAEVPSVTIANPENGKIIQITTPDGTIITCNSAVKESGLTAQDASYQYPLGLVDFCFDTEEESNDVTLTFVTDLKPIDVVVRKYNPSTQAYAGVPGATVTKVVHQGQPALQITYTIVDNGPLDLDPDVGEIADPVGIGIAPASGANLASTGESAATYLFVASTLIAVSFAAVGSRKFTKLN